MGMEIKKLIKNTFIVVGVIIGLFILFAIFSLFG